MTDITKIVARIWTADVDEGVGTGDAYLGIAGREFVLDSTGSDLRTGQHQDFVFGEDTNVENAEFNDPRKPQLTTTDLARYPVYIRYEGTDGWCLERAWVYVNPGENEVVFDNLDLAGEGDSHRIWLRNGYGRAVYLTRTSGSPGTPDDPDGSSNGASLVGTRVVWGNVDADGNVHSGSGDFLASKTGTGQYTIAFQRPFRTPPSATANISDADKTWYTTDNAHVTVAPDNVVITTGNASGQHSDRPFSFQIIGR